MKKQWLISIMLVCLLLPGLGFAADSATFRVERLVSFLTLGTGAMTGTYFPLGNAFANVWTTHSDNLSVMSHSTRGSIDNMNLLQRHELNLAIAQSDIVLAAINGTGSFAGRPFSGLKILMALYPEVVQVVVAADSGIVNVQQLRGRKVVVGSPGSGNALTTMAILSACGMTAADFFPVYVSYDDVIQDMERREYDAAVIMAGIPTRSVSELQKRMPLRILSFSPAETASLTAGLPYLTPMPVPANTYGLQNGNSETLALMAMLVCDDRLSDELGFRLCRDLYANLDYLRKVHERARDINSGNFMKGVPQGSLHSGAARFFSQLRQQP